MSKSAQKKNAHHHLRRLHGKYKRYAAAVAGAAIMAGIALPGIPAAKALAADNNSPEASVSVKHKTERNKNLKKPPGSGWHEHKDSWPSSDENQAWVTADGRIFYRSDNAKRDNHWFDNYLSSPVEFVRHYSDMYGFDSNLDSYRLLFRSSDRAMVEVTKHDTGRLINVLLERTNNNEWTIVQIRAL